ncbi:MAG: prepilin-type N-terminal cleavage/methylation domain-containing protein [Phycisphaerales bacterium]|nr:MAG: prepilin-type N-terminal cleavage/methylation domain-containing protein [Phycisphaerales bacterium]
MKKTGHKTGFTIAELLIAIAIAAMLLVAVAVAFNASSVNYRQNEDIFRTINTARQALMRITSQLRTATAVDPNAPANECTLITANGDDITYRYDGAQSALYLITNDDLSDSDYLLCDNITALTCTKNLVVEDSQIKVKNVQISITVASGNARRTVSAAAVIRRNLN